VFVGKYRHAIDVKGRLAIPARFREQLPSGSVVTIAPDDCLRCYGPGEWSVVSQENLVSAGTTAVERNLVRRLFAEASELEFDGQGRALIPASLRQAAGLGGTAVVVGVNNVVEIWSEDRWDALETETAKDYTRIADEVANSRRAH
jgi:MraZ protein